MKRQSLYILMALVVIFSMALGSCKPAATPTPEEAPAATEAPAPAEAPAAEAPAFEGMKVEAPDCNYGTADMPAKLKSIEAVDKETVKFTLCQADPAFLSKVAFSVFSIQDKDYLDANGGDSIKMSDNVNGTGPYIVKEWVRGDHITYEANPDYWGEKAKVKTLIFRWSEQSAQRLLELESGTVDGIDNPAPEDFDKISEDANLTLYPRLGMNIFYIGFNNKMEPFNNEKVRQAFAMAVDKKHIVDNFYPKGSSVAEQFVPDAMAPGFSKDLKWYDYNVDEAKKLLAEAGYPNGLEVTLTFRNVVRAYLPTPDKVAQDLQQQLSKIGVTVKLEEMESAAFIDATAAGEKAFYLLGWNMDYPDATNFYDYHFATPANQQFGDIFSDIAENINKAAVLSDPAERQEYYDKVNDLIKTHVPMIPVAHGGSATVFKANVEGAHASPLGNEVFSVMDNKADQLVWMQNGEPAALWCSDETDGETLRACEQVYNSLLGFKVGGATVEPALAEKWEVNQDLTEWTFNLRKDVKFHNGAELDANDVVATYVAFWDTKDPNHKGRTATFEYFNTYFGAFLNAAE